LMNRDPSLSHSQVYSIINQNIQYLKDASGIIGSVNLERWRQLTDAALNKGLLREEPNWSHFFHKDLQEAWEKI
jgi:hypothetical protein